MLVQRNDWGSLDGIAWTPWGTILAGEERTGGKVWEIDPFLLQVTARPALGLKAHEGIRIKWGVNVAQGDFEMPDNVALDHDGNLYITEDPATAPNTKRGDDIWVATPPRARYTSRPRA